MIVLYCLCFVFFMKHGCSYVIFPDVIDTAVNDLRVKREASCGGDFDVSDGTAEIQLPTELYNGTEFYRANEDCTWHVKTTPDHYMILRSEYFSLEESENCTWDYVEITEGVDASVPNRFCGWDPMTYITASNEMTLHFVSDISFEDKGFKFIIESKQRDANGSKCDSSIIGGEASKIMNRDNSGTGCFYRIQAPNDKVVELDLKMLDFGSATCEEERIVVYEGLTTHGEPLAEICSDSLQVIQPYHANILLIEYRNPLKQEGERFTIEYSFVEDNFTRPPTPSTTTSPVGGNNDCSRLFKYIDPDDAVLTYTAPEYENNKECIVVVRNTMLPDHVVQIDFLYFDTEESENCTFDSLKIRSGERNDSAMLGGPYCGESLQDRTFVTSGNSLRLEFKTDESFAFRGFKADISFVPTKECDCDLQNQVCILQNYEKKCIRGQKCEAKACQNRGTCVKTGDKQKCYCNAGYIGDDCSQSDGEQAYHLHFSVAPGDRSLKRDASHTEECAVNVPKGVEVKYEWRIKGALIGPYNKSLGFGVHPGGLLKIDKFTDDLEGHYSCLASTSAGTAEHTFEYEIVEDCDVRIHPGPQSESKKINENALLICHVDSHPEEVRWKKDGFYIDFEKNPRFKKYTNNYLGIKNVGLSDAGMYTCEAKDKRGCYSYKEGKLTVIDVKPLNRYCGISVHDEATMASSKISKGKDARPKGNPWHVTFNTKNNRTFCGGTLISQKYILTAAHCINEFEETIKLSWAPENIYILLGTTHCSRKDGETIRTFKGYITHPEYGKSAQYDSDIALIELDSPVAYTKSIRPICLEPGDYNDRVFLEYSDSLTPIPGKVAGCGKTRERGSTAINLQEVHLPYVRRDACEESLASTSHTLTDRMICAGSNIARTGDTCGGDSGGGLVMAASGRWVQTGIVSWAAGSCDTDQHYGVYTNVGKFYDWIEGIAKFSEEEVPNFTGQF